MSHAGEMPAGNMEPWPVQSTLRVLTYRWTCTPKRSTRAEHEPHADRKLGRRVGSRGEAFHDAAFVTVDSTGFILFRGWIRGCRAVNSKKVPRLRSGFDAIAID